MRAVAVLIVVAACGKSSDSKPAPKADDFTELGGWVREVDGAVVAHRRGETVPLAVGTKVAADSVIDTGQNGRVVIELAQNHAKWELGPNSNQKVSDSIAWKLAPGTPTNIAIRDTAGVGKPPDPQVEENVSAVRAAVEARRADFIACLGQGTKITVIVDTSAKGLESFSFRGVTKEGADCAAKVMQTFDAPKRPAHAVVRITK